MDQVLDAEKVMETSARVASCGEGARISRTSPTANAAPPASVNVAVAAKCSAFIRAYDQRSNDAFVLAGWLTGYLSAINQHAAETFDLAPWQSTEVLMLLAKDLCAQPRRAVLQGGGWTGDDPLQGSVAGVRRTDRGRLQGNADEDVSLGAEGCAAALDRVRALQGFH